MTNKLYPSVKSESIAYMDNKKKEQTYYITQKFS